jgi:hypothetical protein
MYQSILYVSHPCEWEIPSRQGTVSTSWQPPAQLNIFYHIFNMNIAWAWVDGEAGILLNKLARYYTPWSIIVLMNTSAKIPFHNKLDVFNYLSYTTAFVQTFCNLRSHLFIFLIYYVIFHFS